MTDSMIERVARVICAQRGRDPDELCQGEGKAKGRSWLGWQAFATEAQAIITAMRSATPQMIRRAEADYDKAFPNDAALADVMWHAMIDAALAEEV